MRLNTPLIMGIINVTPDSFFAGSRKVDEQEILYQAEKMRAEGATLIDIGGYSSRPGAADIPEAEEEARVLPVISMIKKNFPDALLSVDTFRAGVAEKAVDTGLA